MRKVLEAVSLAALLAMFAMLAMYSDIVPEQIPIHWTPSGTPDKWGGKETLWIFPAIGAVIYVGLSIAGFVRRANPSDAQQELVGHMISAVKVVTMISFAVMSREKLEAALGNTSSFGGMLAIVMVVLMGVGLVYARRAQGTEES
jgi:uncharacterized membrane protein